MALEPYRRHGINCVGYYKNSTLSDEAKRLLINCNCPVWVRGTLPDGGEVRESCKTRDWEEAKRRIAQATGQSLVGNAAVPNSDKGKLLAWCITEFLGRRESEIGEEARRQYRRVLGWLRQFAEKHRVVYVKDLTLPLLEDFKHNGMGEKNPMMEGSTRATYYAHVITFVGKCEKWGWIEARLADRMEGHKFEHEETKPFTETEITKLLDAAPRVREFMAGTISDHPLTFTLLIELMLATGLRVSDAIQFNPAKLMRHESGAWKYPFLMRKRRKTKKPRAVSVLVPNSLVQRINAAHSDWFSSSKPFDAGPYTYSYVRDRLAAIGEAVGIEDCRCHRLRDSFAHRLYLRGASLDTVSKLLCHSSVTVTEQAYSSWTWDRQTNLDSVAAQYLKQISGD